jgi:ubiquinone/menaquinone biosynthesis C-methylase UbiE
VELCRQHATCRVIAGDAAIQMLELARYNIEIASLRHRIQLSQIDAKQLGFTDHYFDLVMSNSIIHHLPEPRKCLAEAVRVCRVGGWLFFRDLLRPANQKELDHLVQTYAGNENQHQRQMFEDSLHAALDLDEIRGLVGELGFPNDTVQQTSDRHWTWAVQKS